VIGIGFAIIAALGLVEWPAYTADQRIDEAAGQTTSPTAAQPASQAVVPIAGPKPAEAPRPSSDPAAQASTMPAGEPAARRTRNPGDPPQTWHATAFVSGIGGYRVIHYWSEGPSMRAETLIGGHPITTIVHGDRYAVIDQLTGRALEIGRSAKALSEDASRLRPFAFEQAEIRADGGEKVEEVDLSGVPVEVWRITDDSGRRTVWVSKQEPYVPLRVETFVRGGAQTVKIDYSNWGFDLEIRPSFFAIPGGLEVERLSYDEYMAKSAEGPVGPAPILYPDLLHGARP
jgi:outer membrane lipoprotein-sorting protein